MGVNPGMNESERSPSRRVRPACGQITSVPLYCSPLVPTHSVKSELAKGLREVKGRIKGLEDRLAAKKKALGA